MTRPPFRAAAIALGAFSAACAWFGPAAAQTGDPAAVAGRWILDTRLRYEGVSQDGLEGADAVLFRARAGYESAAFRGMRALIEVEGVGHVSGTFNDTIDGETAFATIPDPETFEINRLQLMWAGAEGLSATIGRQRIILHNARFVGNVGFRMNEQTFDALRLEARPLQRLGLTYLHIDGVRRTLGDESTQGEWRSDSHVIQADLDGGFGKLTAYALLLDFASAAAMSSQTYGARWQDGWTLSGYNARLTLEAAAQSDYGNAPSEFSLGYQAVELAVRRGAITVTAGGERLEGDDVRGFSTPLATLHAFQGWADVFTATPSDGVRDLSIGASYNTPAWPIGQPVVLTLRAHTFADDEGGAEFGDEIDAAARFTLTPHASLELAAATFDGEEARFADRTKLWVSLEYRL